MQDQYGEEVPNDLVLIPHLHYLSGSIISKDMTTVVNATWYDVMVGDKDCALLCVSAKRINYLSEDKPQGEVKEVLQVDDILKRWSGEDGFYHA